MQVSVRIKEDIQNEVYQEGEMLPSEFELSQRYGVNRETIREALEILAEEGLVIHRYGVGTFVHSRPLFTAGIEEMDSVTNMIKKANMTPKTIYLSSTVEAATPDDMEMFRLERTIEMIELERVRMADGTPVVYCVDRLPYEYVKGHSLHEIKSIFNFLENNGKTITHAIAYIEPIGYDEYVSEILECGPETALLLLKQLHYDQNDQPLLYSLNYFRSDKFHFHVVRKRQNA